MDVAFELRPENMKQSTIQKTWGQKASNKGNICKSPKVRRCTCQHSVSIVD